MDPICKALAVKLKWSMSDVRALVEDLEGEGIQLVYAPVTKELCSNCAAHYATETGFCIACENRAEVERQRMRDEDEQKWLMDRAEKAINATKSARKRMRRKFLANPRDAKAKELWAAVEEFLELIEDNYRGQEESDDEPRWTDQ